MFTVLKRNFQQKHNLSDFQMKQLKYLWLTLSSEIVKLIILGCIFHNKFLDFLFATVILLLLRITTGGLHFQHFWSCFLFSFLYYFLCISIMPSHYSPPKYIQLILLFFCILANYCIGGVTSSKRPLPSDNMLKKCRTKSFIIIFFYLTLVYIIPENYLIFVGFWVIILHTIQLICAYFLQKGGYIKHVR